MGFSKIDRFLSEATTPDQEGDASLRKDQLYGLYTSWCMLNQFAPATAGEFWSEMKSRRIRSSDSRLRMTGAAAADYILATRPVLV